MKLSVCVCVCKCVCVCVCVCVREREREREGGRKGGEREGWCFELSQPQRIISGLKETFLR